MRVLVAGMVAADPRQGGATWAVLQYVRGFEELGHEVWLVDPGPVRADSRAYFAALGLGSRAFFGAYDGPVPDVLVNLSGVLRDEPAAPIRVYVDLDPFFTQVWHAQGADVGLDDHTHYVTLGRDVPRTGHEWIHTLPPVALSAWKNASAVSLDAFTTVGNLRSYGPVEVDGVRYGQKAHSLRRLLDLPAVTGERFAIALDAHPGEPDLRALRKHGWRLLEPRTAAGTPDRYSGFVRGSKAEIGIAKEGYVVSRCGWFSDRSAAYLASGRPVVAQDTGFGDSLPVGAGLFAFTDTEGAAAAMETLAADYGRHARAARAIAEEHLDAQRVLGRLLREVGAERGPARSIHDVSNAELAAALGARSVTRRPFEYRSSAPMAEVVADGRTLLFKDLSRSALTERVRVAKPSFLHDPRREPEVYRLLLANADLGTARFEAAIVDPRRERFWLVVEKVEGEPLYQLDLEHWPDVARWLARCHVRFAGTSADWLIRYDREFFELWPTRAGIDLPGYASAVERLATLPVTLVHGDFYPSNVLVAEDRVCPVDWERAGVGPGVLDVAALSLGLGNDQVDRVAEAYRLALPDPPAREAFAVDLACARLALVVQWLGWSPDWSPPPEHARDWRAELPALAERAGL